MTDHSVRYLLIVAALVYLGCAPGVISGRVLADTDAAKITPANRWANTVRAGSTTQQAINDAVEAGAHPLAVRRAGHVGSQMAYAASQGDQEVFDSVEMEHRDRNWIWGKRRALLGASKVQKTDITPADRTTNSIRAQAVTSAAIQDAVDAGGNPAAIRRANHVGNMMSYAAVQGDQEVFDSIERDHSDRSGGQWPGQGHKRRVILGIAKTDKADITPADRTANSIRAQAVTSAAIQDAVNSGGNPAAIRRANHVGNMMSYAAVQGDQEVFDSIERDHSDRSGGQWPGQGHKRRVLLGTTKTDKADITPADRLTNTIRAQAVTSAAIQDAIDSGGDPLMVKLAGHVGNMMTFAATQADQEVFDSIERDHSDRNALAP